jgi:hypothetical protein
MTAIEITKDNFQSEVLDSELPVLLDLWAAWCGPAGWWRRWWRRSQPSTPDASRSARSTLTTSPSCRRRSRR